MSSQISPSTPAVFAAIDVGTNAARLKLVRLQPDGTLLTIANRREPVRPGDGVFSSGEIAKPVAERLLETLADFGELCRKNSAAVRAVATSGLRNARNADWVQRRAKAEAGVELEVISGQEEADLIARGVLNEEQFQGRCLIMDIGGGSTELSLAQGGRPVRSWSLSVGSVRLTELHRGEDGGAPPLESLRPAAMGIIEDGITPGETRGIEKLFGSSGTVRSLSRYCLKDWALPLTRERVARCVEELALMDYSTRLRHFNHGRADIITAGALILECLMTHLSLPAIYPVACGLREGILLEMIQRHSNGE